MGHASLPSVAFLGLGNMGAPMAANLAKKGFSLRVWNRSHGRVEAFVRSVDSLSVRAEPTPRGCAKGVDVIVTMVSDRRALEEVLAGDTGLLAGLEPGAVVIDMSTIGRAAALAIASAVEAVGGRFIDAPVSGTVRPAERGELVALVGARPEDLDYARPVLDAMCKRVLHAGGVGQGSALKVVLNGLGAHHLVGLASMLVLGGRAGISRELLVEAITGGAFATPAYVGKKQKLLARDYAPEFSLALTMKDTLLNTELQREAGMDLAVVGEIRRELEEAMREGLGDEDLIALEKHFLAG
jgi:3-hydroxyisobutyrate dehydrogenase